MDQNSANGDLDDLASWGSETQSQDFRIDSLEVKSTELRGLRLPWGGETILVFGFKIGGRDIRGELRAQGRDLNTWFGFGDRS